MIGEIKSILARVMVPLVRIALKKGLSYGDFQEILRWAYVDVAQKEYEIPGKKQSVSRICVLTGLSRKDVNEALIYVPNDETARKHQMNRARRVLTGWASDEKYTDSKGKPLELKIYGEAPSFESLVVDYSGDMPYRAILDEMLRVGSVEKKKDDRLKLLGEGFVPLSGEMEKLQILREDVESITDTIQKNIYGSASENRFHKRVIYDYLSPEELQDFKPFLKGEGNAFLQTLNQWLKKRKKGKPLQGGKRAGVVVYYFEGQDND